MACVAAKEPRKNVATGLNSVRVKMNAIVASTREEVAREKRAKEASAEVNLREERALSKKRKILDQIAKAEKDMEKIEIQESYCKERMYFANQRYEENAYTKEFLEKNKVDVGSIEQTLEQYQEKTRATVDDITKKQRAILDKEKEILAAEKREMLAKEHIARMEEKLRAVERAGNKFAKNYTPMNEKEYLEKLDEVRDKIARAVAKRKKFEKRADALEKETMELEKKIVFMKKRNAELKQTTNELKGSRV